VDYLVKPFGRERLTFALARAFDWHYEAADRRGWRGRLSLETDERFEDLRASVAAVRRSAADPLEALLGLIGDDDSDLVTHSRRVAAMAQRIGKALGLTTRELAALNQGALLHDLGKLAVPHTILRKPAALSLDEKAIIRRHPDVAAQILLSIGGFETAAAVLRASSGRFDEPSYDSEGEADPIRLAGHIVAAAAAYDAMTHRQIYRDALPSSEAASEMLRCSSTQFDPVVVSMMLEVLGGLAAIH
jgi:HD-GYP domain-containing protein (c-di-GMP phosphodiesterase class II)